MNTKMVHKLLFAGGIAVALLIAFSLASQPARSGDGHTVLSLYAPPFLGAARADAASVASVIGDEAGVSAYYQASAPIAFTQDFKAVFRTIEAETTDYIIGSVAVENYPESEDVHVYVHTDGWMMAYYLKADPVAKIFDWQSYTGASIDTKLEKTLTRVASFAGVSYTSATFYDFRYPNATHLMLIAENESNGNDFTVNLPSSFVYYERSWGLYNTDRYYGSDWVLDGVIVGSVCNGCVGQGILTAAQLLPDTTHTVEIDDYGGLALIYRMP